jgi:DNA-binding response OmpR family regulator
MTQLVVRVVVMLAGLVTTAYGGLLLAQRGWQNFEAALTWLVAGVLLHDAVLAPLTVVAAWAALRVAGPARVRPWAVAVVLLGSARGPTTRRSWTGPTGPAGACSWPWSEPGYWSPRSSGGGGRPWPRREVPVARVMVVDDDVTVREVVVTYLRAAGHDVGEAADGESALTQLNEERADLVVLDLMLPGIDGLEVCLRLRKRGDDVPVIMLTALGSETDRVVGLELGADDYVTKPFSPRELVLRVDSVLRRAGESGTVKGTVVDGDLVVDSTEHTATLAGRRLSLTVREFDLLRFLVSHPGEAFSRDELLKHVWGWSFGDQSTVTVHVRRLREKLEVDPSRPQRLATVWGVGYRWEAAS